jgi:hypothetical protein
MSPPLDLGPKNLRYVGEKNRGVVICISKNDDKLFRTSEG